MPGFNLVKSFVIIRCILHVVDLSSDVGGDLMLRSVINSSVYNLEFMMGKIKHEIILTKNRTPLTIRSTQTVDPVPV